MTERTHHDPNEERERTISTLEKEGFPVTRHEDGSITVGEIHFQTAALDSLTPAGIADISGTEGKVSRLTRIESKLFEIAGKFHPLS